ncbi:MAG: DUF6090 family protein, partial [Saprospiraceae bacterium]|nr:DUF6090 family protein [Saprospiraceae bacterium]
MLTFFRRIRKGSLAGDATSKYFLYAIGEIALVVIGILIALQINNWKEWRKDRFEEREVLKNLSRGFKSDLDNHFAKHLLRTELDILRANQLLQNFTLNRPYNDSLRLKFGVLSATGDKIWTPQLSAYKRLESKGLDLITNDSLLNSIIDIYNLDYPRINNIFDNYLKNIYDYGRPIARRQFLTQYAGQTFYGFIPIDYSSLKEDAEFLNTLKTLYGNSQQINNQL